MNDLFIDTRSLEYPLTLTDIRRRSGRALSRNPADAELQALGYARVLRVPKPAGDVVTEIKPARANGVWQQQWAVRSFNASEMDDLRLQLWEEIKTIRDRRAQQGGYFAGGHWYHSDTFSRSQQLGLVHKADMIERNEGDMHAPFEMIPGQPLMWKTMDGTFVPITPHLAKEVFRAAEAQDAATFRHAEVLWSQVQAVPDPRSINLNDGWPPIYQE